MTHVSIADLKARLSEFIAIAKRGEEVIVTDRGRPVVRLAAISGNNAHDAHLQELIRTGVVRPPQRPFTKDLLEMPTVKDPEGLLLSALLEERAEGW